MLDRVKKLKGKGLAELADRGRQSALALAERLGASSKTKLASDQEFFDVFDLEGEISSTRLFYDFRSSKKLYASFDEPNHTLSIMQTRFPNECEAVVSRANRICGGHFDLLGYDKLFFESTIPNWHFEPVSRTTSPLIHWSKIDEMSSPETGDKKIVWELSRHQYFTTLGRAHWITKDEKYADVFFRHIEDWIARNPPKMGLNWLSSLEIAFRSISWLWALQFFKHSPQIKPAGFIEILKYLHLNGQHLESYLSTYSSPNTHLTGEALGLCYLGALLPEFKSAARWKELGYRVLMDALNVQIRPDGVYCEQSSQYHRYTTDFYLNLMILRRREGLDIDPKHREKLRQLLEFQMFTTQPNGKTPLFGDDDGGRLHFLDERDFSDFRSTLALGAVLLDEPRLKFVAGDASPELLWLLGAEGLDRFDEIDAVEPEETVKAFKSGGVFTVRDSWKPNANFLLVDCGEHGFLNGGHAHADALQFVLSVDGEPVFVDSGTYNYTSDPAARDLYRSTGAHNCLTVNGESSSIPAGPFSWKTVAKSTPLEWRSDTDAVIFRGTHDGFERLGVAYEREIVFGRDKKIIINDSIRSTKSNAYELNFILSPYIDAKITSDSGIELRTKGGNRLLLTIDSNLLSRGGIWSMEDFGISQRYGSLTDSIKLVFKCTADGDLHLGTAITCVRD